jgi:surface protein
MPARTSADEVVDLLVAIYPESNYFALNFTCVGGYNVTWGDGVNQGYASATVANYQYDYNDPDIVDTNGPVTFDSATSTVNRTAHGYTDGMTISFATITTTTGIIQNQQYYVVNATANTFQVSDTVGGTALFLIGNGTGAILPYKQVLVRVIPITPGNLLTNVNLQVKNTTTGLNAYAQPILDATISAGCTTLAIGSTSASVCIPKMMERCTILRHNDTTIDSLFSSCSSLQSVPLFNTTNVTTMANMFNGCTALQSVPLFDTTNVASMLSMFKDCFALVTVPLFDTTNVTNMTGMFTSCVSLQSVPLFNTGKVTIMGGNTVGMFSGCFSLQSVPLFDTTNVTNMQQMFISCNSLQTVPLFNTAKVTTMTGMFSGCASLQTVPLFNTANVTLMTSMFNQCYSLQSVPLFDTAKVTDMINMFTSCNSLISVPLFNTANVTTMGSMFSGCFSLKSVPLFDTSKVTSFSNMFNQCTSLQSVPAFDTTAVTGTTAFSTSTRHEF